ncbi:hypothetical protein AWC27_02265 [Mycobacterium szulgai]|uniref:Dual OB-containing domain-containing protein n=1 Tax=Mycobacterium szulgai TaxID=1787 RepID=A0A1X2EET3_MYCSZ|nr:hypothetical protein AWC27_02265 [Mycobacterium szulgai]
MSAPPSGSVPEQVLSDGAALRVLDVVTIGLSKRVPYNYQTENWLLDASYSPWQKDGQADLEILAALEEHPESLWTNNDKTQTGVNDLVSPEDASSLGTSLTFIRVENVDLKVFTDYGKTKMLARFHHAGTEYALKVTDPVYWESYGQSLGVHQLGESFLTVSLALPFRGYSSKLVAAIIQKAKVHGGSNN